MGEVVIAVEGIIVARMVETMVEREIVAAPVVPLREVPVGAVHGVVVLCAAVADPRSQAAGEAAA